MAIFKRCWGGDRILTFFPMFGRLETLLLSMPLLLDDIKLRKLKESYFSKEGLRYQNQGGVAGATCPRFKIRGVHCLKEFKNDNKTSKLLILNDIMNRIFLLVGWICSHTLTATFLVYHWSSRVQGMVISFVYLPSSLHAFGVWLWHLKYQNTKKYPISLCTCYDLNVVSKVIILGGEALGRWLGCEDRAPPELNHTGNSDVRFPASRTMR